MKLLPWFLPFGTVHRRVLNSAVQPALRQLSAPLAFDNAVCVSVLPCRRNGFCLAVNTPLRKGKLTNGCGPSVTVQNGFLRCSAAISIIGRATPFH